MRFRCALCLLVMGWGLLPACATPVGPAPHHRHTPGEQDLAATDNCVHNQLAYGAIQFQTCVLQERPELREDEPGFRPQLMTVVTTPVGALSIPTRWTVEVRRDGMLVVRQVLFDADRDIGELERFDEQMKIETLTPLGQMMRLKPGSYEITYTRDGDDGQSRLETVIEVEDFGE